MERKETYEGTVEIDLHSGSDFCIIKNDTKII